MYSVVGQEKSVSEIRWRNVVFAAEVIQRCIKDILPADRLKRLERNGDYTDCIYRKKAVKYHREAIRWFRFYANNSLWFQILGWHFTKKQIERLIQRRLNGEHIHLMNALWENDHQAQLLE